MGKKTKKQKILAQTRRQQFATSPLISEGPHVVNYKFNEAKAAITSQNTDATPTNNYSYITHDLLQTVVLTVLAICAQLCVYYLNSVKHLF